MQHPESPTALITATLDTVREGLLPRREGVLADYIPELATVDPERFGIVLCSVTGSIYESGDTDDAFTIQSVSKAFVYSLALDDHGIDGVHAHVGAEPSGEAYNSVKLEKETGRPPNPMVNAGAIVTTSLVKGANTSERFQRILSRLSAFAGRDLGVNEDVFASEQSSGDRNRALAYLMHGAGSLIADVNETLETYFRQCSILVTARDLAVMGATLANGGVNPVTDERVTSTETCQHVLTIMATCGMYDDAGEWLLRAGLPAKSGVAGGLVASSPGEFGLGLFSPRLDQNGCSIRGAAAAREIAARFGLHVMHYPIQVTSAALQPEVTDSIDGPEEEHRRAMADLLRSRPDDVAIWRLRGFVDFAVAEGLYLGVEEWLAARPDDRPAPATMVFDFSSVDQVQTVAVWMLSALVTWCRERGMRVIASDPQRRSNGVKGIRVRPDLGEAVRDAATA